MNRFCTYFRIFSILFFTGSLIQKNHQYSEFGKIHIRKIIDPVNAVQDIFRQETSAPSE